MANFEYKKARDKAPASVTERIKQYDQLSDEEKKKTPLLYWVLGTGTPAYKMSKKDSEYSDQSTDPSQICGNCKFLYYNPVRKAYICSQIRGRVKVEGWCRLWKND